MVYAASVCRSGAIYGSCSRLCKCLTKALLVSHIDEWKTLRKRERTYPRDFVIDSMQFAKINDLYALY